MGIYSPGRPSKCFPLSNSGSTPPAKPGEYRIRDANGAIVYVGETCNLKRRVAEHVRSGKICSSRPSYEYKVADGRSSSRTRREHEQAKILQHAPSLNRSVGGEGRIAGR